MSKRLFDRAVFWVAMGAAVATLGGIGIGIGTVNLASGQGNRQPWFDIGVAFAILGALGLVWALFLYGRHVIAARREATAVAPAPARPHSPTQPEEPSEEAEPLARLRGLQDEASGLHDQINKAYGARPHQEVRRRLSAWSRRVETELQQEDQAFADAFRALGPSDPELGDRSTGREGMTEEQWERQWDTYDSNVLRSFLRLREEALGRAITRLSERAQVEPGAPPQVRLGDSAEGFELTVEDDELVEFQQTAIFVKARVRIQNRSSKVQRAKGLGIHGTPEWPLSLGDNVEVTRERVRLEQDLAKPAKGPFQPGERRVLWVMITFPWRPDSGEPGYTLIVKDQPGNEYRVQRLARPPRKVGAQA